MLQFGTKNSRRAWHIIPAQEVNSGLITEKICDRSIDNIKNNNI